ncbi:acid protease [Ceraceosorus bombacis]|uniref:Acid protease n=1 Tax=Ceraceosorus bombacis TaxID=401625 RepID=A0A0P1BPH1_9BASI|nr:acid protease [Ceraceosorus bombacis]
MQLGLSFVAGLIATSALVFAAPAPGVSEAIEIPLEKRSSLLHADSNVIDFQKVAAHVTSLRNKYQGTLNNFKVNTGAEHPLRRELPEELKKRATGTVALTDESEQLWHGNVVFGGQTIPIDFDTGSADLVVNRDAYTPGSSSTNTGRAWTAAYGDGTTARGTVYTDSFSIAGISASKVAIGRATTNFLTDANNQGIAGMSFPALSQFGSQYPPFFDSLINQKKVDQSVFTFTLKAGSGSTLFLGGVSGGSPSYSNVDTSNGFWQIPGRVNGISFESIQDTGTTVIVAPNSDAANLCNNVGGSTFTQDGSTYCAYTCSRPPKVSFTFGSFTKALSSATTSFGQTNDGRCVLSVIGGDVGVNAWVTGDSWLQNVRATFNRSTRQVGFTSQ